METKDVLKGAQMFLGGLVLVGGGAAGMAFGVIDPGTGLMLIGNGLGLWGMGNKMEAIKKAFEEKEIKFHELPKEKAS